MFKSLLRKLDKVYTGTEIYIPDAIYPLIKEWMEQTYFHHRTPGMTILKWNKKMLVPYDEEEVLKAYQACPIHLPERILEKSIVIEASLVDTQPEPVQEEVVVPVPEIVVEKAYYKPTKRKPYYG